jgi:hypothetical protein
MLRASLVAALAAAAAAEFSLSGSVFYANNKYTFVPGAEVPTAAAFGRYKDMSETTSGFGQLAITTSAAFDDVTQMHAAGYTAWFSRAEAPGVRSGLGAAVDAELKALKSKSHLAVALGNFAEECHSNSVAHGWHDRDRTFGDFIALVHSELSEALEAFREPRPLAERLFHMSTSKVGDVKPDGILTELADVIIRILDYTGSIHATAQLIEALQLKHAYNMTRPHRHGGKLL